MDINEKINQQENQNNWKVKWKSIDVKEVIQKISDFIKNGKYFIRIIWCIAIIATIFMIFYIFKTYSDTKNLNAKTNELYNLNNYDTSIIQTNNYLKNEAFDLKRINELIDYNTTIIETTQRYNEYLQWVQASYDNFLKYLFLPNLNIRKDNYLWKINDDYVWEKFLENNPYNDIDLIDKRSNFIKDVWANNENNEINNIEIWDIEEDGKNFYITIKVSYSANSYRSFLLLVEKLSMTSNSKNISLINELVYNIREIIKNDRKDKIIEIQQTYPDFSTDKAIWYNLYQRVKWESDDVLIDDEIIKKAISIVAQCGNSETSDYCYYKFRNKYRDIPNLAYSIWIEWNWNITENLKTFFQEMPQIIKIINFTYDGEQEFTDITNFTTKKYVWEIEFRIYWHGIQEEEITEIQNILWEKCLWTPLTADSALEKIESRITNLWNNSNIDTYSTTRLMELKKLITNIQSTYNYLSNYKKVIKTFEIYRMLKEWNVCNL